MSKFKIGDKVETEKGNGIIVAISGYEEQLYIVEINDIGKWGFSEHRLKPYRTAHEKLIDMGYIHEQLSEDLTDEFYGKSALDYIWFSRTEKNYSLGGHVYVDVELSRILTQYLEELEND